MSHPNRVTVPSQPQACGAVRASLNRNRDFLTTRDEGRSPASPHLPSITEDPTQPRWPASMAEVASTGTAVGAIGDAVILEGRLPDSYHHHSAADNLLSFGLRGSARFEWKRGGRLKWFVGGPGCFTIAPAGEDNFIRMDRSMQILTVVFGRDHLRALADREWKPYGPTIELSPVYHQNTPEIVSLGQAFATLMRSPRSGNGLYAETLWTQIAIQLLWHLPVAAAPGRNVGGMTRRRPFPARDRLPRRVARFRDLLGRSRRSGQPESQLLSECLQKGDREDAAPPPDRDAHGQGPRAAD